MKSSSNIDATNFAEIQIEGASTLDLANSQWALIQDLERQYIGKTVHGTKCKFENDNWYTYDGPSSGSRTGINWKLPATEEPALKVLIRAMMFEAIDNRRLEIGSALGIFNGLKRDIIPLINSKRLLAGEPGTLLLGLGYLTDADLMVLLDAQLVLAPSEQKFHVRCYDLSAFHTFANHIAERIPFYQIRARLPWQKSGEQITEWARRRAADINVVFPTSEGYEPLPIETAQPLIEKTLTLIDDHFDHFSEIGPLVAGYNQRNEYDKKYLIDLLNKYSPILGYIVTPPNISERKTNSKIASSVFGWLRKLLYLARGACVNVILLTTGLRNVDIRMLKVGACRPSDRIDMLFYLSAEIQKTNSLVIVPVPGQTDKAFRLLEKIKFSDSLDLIDGALWSALEEDNPGSSDGGEIEIGVRLKGGESLNLMIRDFAAHFDINFISPISGEPFSAHCYRATVAGWLGAASNLSLLLVRRLFGHSNNVMPTVYLNNNPAFVKEREAQKARASAETARQMGLAASQGRLAGIKGDQLERGYREHKSRMELDKQKSHSLTDAEILTPFISILEQRIKSGSVCAFLTPFGVQCMRNPSDTSQPPCAKRANRDRTRDIESKLLRHVSDINPQQCIGTSCTEAMLGPWSTSVLDTLNWYHALLRHQLGDAFSDEHFIESARQFIKQYATPIRKVFGLSALTDQPESQPNGVEEGK